MLSFSAVLPFGFEVAAYRAPYHLTGLQRLCTLNRTYMADAGCWCQLTVLGQSFEFWGPAVEPTTTVE